MSSSLQMNDELTSLIVDSRWVDAVWCLLVLSDHDVFMVFICSGNEGNVDGTDWLDELIRSQVCGCKECHYDNMMIIGSNGG